MRTRRRRSSVEYRFRAGRRRVPLAPRPRAAVRDDAGRHRLGRHGDRHRRPQARRGAAALPRRGRLACSAARSTTSRRSPTSPGSPCRASPTGARSTSSSRRHARSGSRSTHVDPRQARARPRARRSAMLAGRRVAGAARDPRARAGARAGDRRARRSPPSRFDERQLEIARALALRSYVTRAARRPRRGVRRDHARHRGVGPASTARRTSRSREELARHAAAAIDNARLYEEAERRAGRRACSRPSATASSSSTARA